MKSLEILRFFRYNKGIRYKNKTKTELVHISTATNTIYIYLL